MEPGRRTALLRSLAGTDDDFLLDWHFSWEPGTRASLGNNAGFPQVVAPTADSLLSLLPRSAPCTNREALSTQACQPFPAMLGMQPWCGRAVAQRDGVAAESVFDQWITGRITAHGKVGMPSTAADLGCPMGTMRKQKLGRSSGAPRLGYGRMRLAMYQRGDEVRGWLWGRSELLTMHLRMSYPNVPSSIRGARIFGIGDSTAFPPCCSDRGFAAQQTIRRRAYCKLCPTCLRGTHGART